MVRRERPPACAVKITLKILPLVLKCGVDDTA
jgi:hypothetical protein